LVGKHDIGTEKETIMKLAVFGATGTVGTALVPQALAAGHELRILSRNPSKVTVSGPGICVVKGDAKDCDAVLSTVHGTDAVVSMLGGFADSDSIRIGTAFITASMRECGIRRIVIVQGFHLDFPGDPHNVGRKLILPMLYLGSRSLVADSRAMATGIRDSELHWTLIRAPRITRGPGGANVRVGALRIGPWNSIANADIADLVLRSLADPTTIRTAPMVANGSANSSGRGVVGIARTLRDIVHPPRQPTGS
jgi:uncharacterized protein YbjT (DUF2867 family)